METATGIMMHGISLITRSASIRITDRDTEVLFCRKKPEGIPELADVRSGWLYSDSAMDRQIRVLLSKLYYDRKGSLLHLVPEG